VTPFQEVRISLSSPPENTRADPSGKRLIDHRRATVAGVDSQWTGWKNSDVMMVVDLGRTTPVQRVIVGFYRSPGGLVFAPPTLEVSTSDDGTTFTQVTRVQEASPVKDPRPTVRDYVAELNGISARFIRLVATSPGAAPDWHRSPSDPTWIYADEIIVE